MVSTFLSRKDNLPKNGTAAKYALALLTLINFLNYMDRNTLAAVLPHIQKFYDITAREAGYIQTAFIMANIIISPIFGYLGDRISRKLIVINGIAIWSFFTLAGSFVGQNYFWMFVLMRGMVGVGEASYIIVAYSIVGDLFSRESRPLALGIFSLAMPFGCGGGYMVGATAYKTASHLMSSSNQAYAWQWAFRITPILGVIFIITSIFFLPDPERGNADDVPELDKRTSFLTDIAILCQNGSVVFATFGYISLDFVGGSLGYWTPTYVDENHADAGIPFGGSVNFGIATIIGGIGGVLIGVYISKLLKRKFEMTYADALVSGVGLFVCAPSLFCAIILIKPLPLLGWVLVLCTLISMVLVWPLVPNIFLETVVPTRRALVSGISNLIANAFGDAISPVIVGHINDEMEKHTTPHKALQYGLMVNVLVAAIGGVLFVISALFFKRDYRICQNRMSKGRQSDPASENTQKCTCEANTDDSKCSFCIQKSSFDKINV